MKIPKRFKLLARTVEVVDNPQLCQDRNWSGAADYDLDQVQLMPRSAAYIASDAKIEHTFYHEFVHHLLYHAGGAINHKLKEGEYIHRDEEFVDLLASLLQQANNTMEYE